MTKFLINKPKKLNTLQTLQKHNLKPTSIEFHNNLRVRKVLTLIILNIIELQNTINQI
jgi:hypothetical protein